MGSEREAAIENFLAHAGWGEARRAPLAGDASPRRYWRLRGPQGTAVLMDAPPKLEAAPCPAEADRESRAKLGYQALARLAGLDPAAFMGLARELTARGWSAPRVLAADMEHGLVLLEDLGDALFARAIAAGAPETSLYEAAIDLLAALRRASFPSRLETGGRSWALLDYDAVALQAEADLLLDWYVAGGKPETIDPALRADWEALWADAFAHLAHERPSLVLRDVHAENLIWLPEREGPARAGLLDFQDALFGHPAYDLVSLLEDARRDVTPAVTEAMIARFKEKAFIADEAGFARAYAVLGAQRNAKILGIFKRLHMRDGKDAYLAHLPRVARHFLGDLSHPALADLRGLVLKLAPQVTAEARA